MMLLQVIQILHLTLIPAIGAKVCPNILKPSLYFFQPNTKSLPGNIAVMAEG